jgi:hypothetical protein
MNIFPGIIDPRDKSTLLNEIGVRYGTAAPTHTPDKQTELWVILTGGDTRLYAWNGTAWKYKTLDNT